MIRAAFIALCLAAPLVANVWPSFGPGHSQYAGGGATSISPSFTARKIQGSTCLAPCAVHFDAIGMGALSTVPYTTTETTDSAFTREFHSLHFEWNFDDPNSGTWSTGAAAATGTPQSKNYDIGGIAGHLYENPGTYTVTLTVTNPAGESAQTTREVVVGDRTTYFSDANTFCFATTAGTFQGCPLDTNSDGTCDGAEADNCTATADLDLALLSGDGCKGGSEDCANADSGQRRVLFRRGDTFAASTTITMQRASGSPGIVEAFGSGANPRPILDMNGANLYAGGNWTYTALQYTNCNSNDACLIMHPDDDNDTFFGVRSYEANASCWEEENCFYNAKNAPNHSVCPGQPAFDHYSRLHALVEVECDGSDSAIPGYGAWAGSDYTVWMGGHFSYDPNDVGTGTDTSHFRSHHMQHYLIGHVDFTDTSPGREVLQIRQDDYNYYTCCPSGFDAGTPTESSGMYIIVQDNYFEQRADSPYTTRVCADSGCNCNVTANCGYNIITDPNNLNEYGGVVPVHDLIFERNFYDWPTGTAGSKNGVYDLLGSDITIRNEIYDMQDAFTGGTQLILVTGNPTQRQVGSAGSGNIHLLNNTVYFDHSISNTFNMELISGNGDGCPSGCYAYNNLLVAPNHTGSLAHSGSFTQSGNLKITTPNPFVGSVPGLGLTDPDDFKLAVGSAPIGAGYDFVPGTDLDRWVYDDAMRLCRPGNADGWDVGAHEYGASACY